MDLDFSWSIIFIVYRIEQQHTLYFNKDIHLENKDNTNEISFLYPILILVQFQIEFKILKIMKFKNLCIINSNHIKMKWIPMGYVCI